MNVPLGVLMLSPHALRFAPLPSLLLLGALLGACSDDAGHATPPTGTTGSAGSAAGGTATGGAGGSAGNGGAGSANATAGSGGTNTGGGAAGAGTAGEAPRVPYSLELEPLGAETPCPLTADGRALVVTVKNSGTTPTPPLQVVLATANGGPSAGTELASVAPGASQELELLRGPAAGFRESWDYEVKVDGGDAGAQRLGGTCDNELRARARAGMQVLQGYYDQASGLYNGNEWWRGANMLEDAIDFSRELGDGRYLDTIDNTFEKNKESGFINEYYDDEGWWALAWVRAYDLTHDPKYLSMAKAIFDDIKASWDPNHCGGGVYWKKETEAKTSISNELFIVLAARLHLRTPGDTGPNSYLDWAQRSWAWFEASGLIGANHQVIDGLDFDTCGPGWDAAFTYNQGVILGGLVDLWRATGDGSLLDSATQIADATIELQTTPDGVLIEAECDPKCGSGDGTTFKGVFARNVAYLYEATALPRYRAFLLRQSDAIWQKNRSAMNQLGLNWQGPFDQADAARQAAALDAVIGGVRAGDMNLAIAGAAEGSGSCTAAEAADRAVDGNARSKWCAPGSGGQTLSIDLGQPRNVTGFVVRHAESQGEDPAWNTSAFEIGVSEDGASWTDVVTVTGNTTAVTTHYVPLVAARHVRLHVSQAESSPAGGAARIFELEVLGVDRAAP